MLHYVVGDIHGCYQELLLLEQKIASHAKKRGETAFLVSVGDMVDRGPDSAKVVRHFREGTAAGTHAAIMGNHEALFLEAVREQAPQAFAAAGVAPPPCLRDYRAIHGAGKGFSAFVTLEDFRELQRLSWTAQGGGATLASFGNRASEPETWQFDPADIGFLATLPLIWENEQAVVTHALCGAAELAYARQYPRPPANETETAAIQMAMWGREIPKVRPDETRVHVSGHTIRKVPMQYKKVGVVQVDTGCCAGRRLTAYAVESGEFVSVKKIA